MPTLLEMPVSPRFATLPSSARRETSPLAATPAAPVEAVYANRNDFTASPMQMLWHTAQGQFVTYTGSEGGPIGWVNFSHRGIQPLDNLELSRSQKQAAADQRFDFRLNTAFEAVIRACAVPRDGHTWITEGLIQSYLNLYRAGYAYSAEVWEGGQLVGGVFGTHVGSFVSIASMFHRVPNAGKAVYARCLLHLRERGFAFADIYQASEHLRRWGAQDIPHWQFRPMARSLVCEPLALVEGGATPVLPRSLRWALACERGVCAVGGRCRRAAGRFILPFRRSHAVGAAA